MTRYLLAILIVLASIIASAAVRRTLVLNGDIERIIIPIDVARDTYICAEYSRPLTAGKRTRGCWDAARVRDKILHDAEPDQCE